ncbi:MAG: hypothetical protein LBC51_11795 [Treponema sp.]|jgi:hypothetical protein|nr:hypothetical protein [Treponema sp.]
MTSEKPRDVYTSNYSEKHESTQELDTYGVWVKSESQAISDPIPDISDMLNFPNEPEALSEEESALQTYNTFSLESTEPELTTEQQDFIQRESIEKMDETSIDDRFIGVSGEESFVEPITLTDELFDELSQDIVIEDFLAVSVPPVDAAGPQRWDAGLSQEQSPAIPDTPQEAPPVPSMYALDAEAGLQVLRNILEELTTIRHEVSALKELVIRRETAAATLEPQKAEGGEEDEKVTITGDELTNIFQSAVLITKAVSPEYTDTAPLAQGIEVTLIDEEPEYGADDVCKEAALLEHSSGKQVLDKKEESPLVLPDEDGGHKDASHADTADTKSADPSGEVFLMDDLFIENGSMKDIPIELESEDEEEIDYAFDMIESLIDPEDLAKIKDGDEDEPPDDRPPGSSSGAPEREEKDLEASTFSGETQVPKPFNLKQEMKNVLTFMDQLLESLPEDKIGEFAESDYFDPYQKLCNELGIS